MTDPETMLSRLRSLDGPADGKLINDFLEAILDGFRPQSISELIGSKNIYSAYAGAWLVSEIGGKHALDQDDIAQLYQSSSYYFRYTFLDYCMTAEYFDDGMLEGIWLLMDDWDIRVRARAIEWVAGASTDAVSSMLDHCRKATGYGVELSYDLVDRSLVAESPLASDRRARALLIGILIRKSEFASWKALGAAGEDQLTLELLSRTDIKVRP